VVADGPWVLAPPPVPRQFGFTPLHYVDRKSIASQLISNGCSLRTRNYVSSPHTLGVPIRAKASI
jgi:hypothetical protein